MVLRNQKVDGKCGKFSFLSLWFFHSIRSAPLCFSLFPCSLLLFLPGVLVSQPHGDAISRLFLRYVFNGHDEGRRSCRGAVNASVVSGSHFLPTPRPKQRKEHFSVRGWLSCWKGMADGVIFGHHKCGRLK